ncbi:MAG: 3'(2'), 5'-bisphosphate nucleotidase [Lentimonas sp.]|jgi:3'(2'), 5'-bisphosphate nucleotidase
MFNKVQISQIVEIAKQAGDVILEYYRGYKELSVEIKGDDSPVTKADLAANDLIVQKLNRLFPEIAAVSEENSAQENLKAAQNDQYFMIDPLDGTSSFIKKSDEFTVNIALIKNSKVVFGVIYLPAKDLMYFSNENDQAVKIENFSGQQEIARIKVLGAKNNLRIICTQREPEKSEIINDLNEKNISVKEIVAVASSYKFCLIAEGDADFYPRKVHIKAWDVAAGHAIVKAAGGNMINSLSRKEIIYEVGNEFKMPFFEVF